MYGKGRGRGDKYLSMTDRLRRRRKWSRVKCSVKTTKVRKRVTDKGTQCEDNEQNGHEDGGCRRHDVGSHFECQWSQRTSEKKRRQSGPQEKATAGPRRAPFCSDVGAPEA